MDTISFDGRIFRGVDNYDSGDLNPETVFIYHQKGRAVWGEIKGGGVVAGSLAASVKDDNGLDMAWMYVNVRNEVVAGTCLSIPEVLADGRIRLNETWEITKGPQAGLADKSAIEEIAGDK